MKYFIGVTLLLAAFSSADVAQAQDCGTITSIDRYSGEIGTATIDDCDNPFEVNDTYPDGPFLTIHGTVVTASTSVVAVAGPEVSAIEFNGLPGYGNAGTLMSVYAHQENGYAQMPFGPFPVGTYTLVFEEEIYCLSRAASPRWVERLRSILIPTAHAQSPCNPIYVPKVSAITIEFTSDQPTGASSVLFLPGIQASRLYTQRSVIGEDRIWEPSVNFGRDLFDLAMDENGVSDKEVYTKAGDVIDRTNYFLGADFANSIVYETLLGRLEAEQASGTIAAFQALAYDWRYDVQDVVKNGVITGPPDDQVTLFPVNELVKLAQASPRQKVSIVAHSNGGLLAKAMLRDLEVRCDAGANPCPLKYVDKLILLGSPQLGTPKTVRELLHASYADLTVVPVIEPNRFRQVSRNIPAAYGLLPGPSYLTGLSDPLITFDGNGDYLEQFKTTYPGGIDTTEQMINFLLGEEGRDPVSSGQGSLPLQLNEILLEKGQATNDLLATWTAPESVAVTEIVGVGVLTDAGLGYDTVMERVCTYGGCTREPVEQTKVRPKLSLYGDGTVMARSAEGYSGNKETYYVDLQKYNLLASDDDEDDLLFANHVNLGEPSAVQDLVLSLVGSGAEPTSEYISQTIPSYDGQTYDGLSTHSPVYLVAQDTAGNQTGHVSTDDGGVTVVEQIPGSRFFSIGSSSYLYVPNDIEYTVTISGYAEGSFSLIGEELVEGEMAITQFRIENIDSSSSSSATFSRDRDGFSDLTIDTDGDGVVDRIQELSGSIVLNSIPTEPVVEEVSPASLGGSATRVGERSVDQPLSLVTVEPQVAGVSVEFLLVQDALLRLQSVIANRPTITAAEAAMLRALLEVLQSSLQV